MARRWRKTSSRRRKKTSSSRKKILIKQYAWMLVAVVALSLVIVMIEEWLEKDEYQAITAPQSTKHPQHLTPFNTPSQRQNEDNNEAQMKKLEQLKMMAEQMGITQGTDKEQLKKMAEQMGIK